MLDQRLDPTFADYILKVTWTSIIEDYTVGGDRIARDDPRFSLKAEKNEMLLHE